MTALVAFIDARCGCDRCVSRTEDTYRMVGYCRNCKAEPILMLYRSGDPASPQTCPCCGNYKIVEPLRFATDDETPAAVAS